MSKSSRFIQQGCGGIKFRNADGTPAGTLDDEGNLIPPQQAQVTPPPAAQQFANPDHHLQPRNAEGQFVEPTDVEKLSDGALESLLDDVVDEALKRQAKRKGQDPLEYD